MREKNLGTIYMLIGFFLSIYHPIFSLLNNRILTIGFYVPFNPLSYWIEWFWKYGMLTVVLALVGVYFLIIGYRYRKNSPKEGEMISIVLRRGCVPEF